MSGGGAILTLNAGSSSLKFAVFDAGSEQAAIRGAVEDLRDSPRLTARTASGEPCGEQGWPSGGLTPLATAFEAVLALVRAQLGEDLAAVGHRVVHGGASYAAPVRVTPAVLDDLDALSPLDPLHMPGSLAALRAIAAESPELPQVVCFDTAFHASQPAVASRFGLPRALAEAGVRRYGFHGLSYEYIAGRLRDEAPALARGRVVVAHLGSGDSLCAMRNSCSVATTTGFGTLDGLVMATRCGSLDPGVIFHLARQGASLAEIEDMLFHRSGLLGVSGISGDVRVLLASDDVPAREAIELFTYQIALQTGAMVSALGGLDGLVFTAGVGEHAPSIRAEVCERLAWLGLRLDPAANAADAPLISTPDSRLEVRVIPTDEEAMIARHVRAVLDRSAASETKP